MQTISVCGQKYKHLISESRTNVYKCGMCVALVNVVFGSTANDCTC